MANSEAKVLVGHADLAELGRAAAREAGLGPDRCFAVGEIEHFRPLTDLNRWPPGPQPPRSPGTVMMYTSGTTGQPKGVRRPLPEGDPDDVAATAAAVVLPGLRHHASTTASTSCAARCTTRARSSGVTNALHAGHTVVVMRQWTPEHFLELVERHRVTDTQMVPTMFVRLLALPEQERARADVSSVESIFHTGAPCPVDVKQRMMDWFGPVVYETYGGTEGAATIATPRRWLEKPGTVGRPIVGAVVKILDDDGNERPGRRARFDLHRLHAARARRILQGRGEVGVDPARFAGHPRRRRLLRRRRVPLPVRPQDRHGDLRRGEHLPGGGRGVPPGPRRGRRRRGDRRARRRLGRVGHGHRGAGGGRRPRPGARRRARWSTAGNGSRSFKCPRHVDFVDVLPRLPNGKIEKRRLREPYWAGRARAI